MHIIEQLGLDPIIIPEMQRSISPRNDRDCLQQNSKNHEGF